jgi:hypothetical protein
MDNTEGFSAADLKMMNQIADEIAAANPGLRRYTVEEAVGQSFDPALSQAQNEHWALSRLNLA